MSTSVKTTAVPKADLPLIDNRFSLRRKIASTALVDVYWADDLYTPTQGEQDHIVLLVLVVPAITSIPGFATAWSAIMSRPAPPAASYPNILDWGNERDNYWFSCANTKGTLLSEYFNEIDKHGLNPEQALHLTEAVSHALNNVQAGAFGYFEPETTLRTDHGYILLNAPLVKVMHSLLLQQTGVRSPLALHSPWLSPSVAVGDIPVTEDDSFSMASLYQMLLGLQLPYGQQSTLTALARGTPATTSPKLKVEARQLLSQALSLQRNQRPENPEALLKGLSKKNYRKLFLPLAALAALGVVVYASSHLVSKFNDLLHKPDQIAEIQSAAPPKPSAKPPKPETIMGANDTVKPTSEVVALANDPATKPVEPTPVTTTEITPSNSTGSNAATASNLSSNAPSLEIPVTSAATNEIPSSNTQVINTPTGSELNPTAAVTAVEAPVTSMDKTVSIDTPATINTETNANTPLTTETALPDNSTPSTAITEATSSPNTDQQEQLTQLILKATTAFNAGNVEGTEGALNTLRQAWAIDRQDPNTRALLNKVIAQQQEQTEAHVNLNKPSEAKASLTKIDDLIREFTLTDRIEEQVRLESMLEIREREQREAADLLQQARAAVQRGDLSREDGSNNAVAYLNKLMFILPNHAEGKDLLEEVVQKRQAQIKRNIERNRLGKAGTYLDETSRLIRKYNLTAQTKNQSTLETAYRQAVEMAQVQSLPVAQPSPEPINGETYITPDDTALMSQPIIVEPEVVEQPIQAVVTEQPTLQIIDNNQAEQSIRSIPQRPAKQTTNELPIPPQQNRRPAQQATPTINQEAVTTTVQPEELPAEIVIQNPQTPVVESGNISNQGSLDTRIFAPLTEQEIPDSERK